MTSKLFGLFLSLICTTQVLGQYILDTPDGKKVKLNSDGTWAFINSGSSLVKTNSLPPNSTAKYISHLKKYEVWYDPSQWILDTLKKTNSYTWDAYFYSSDYAVQGYCLDSRLSTPIENIEKGIREQWQSTGDITKFSKYKDTINNLPITFFEMEYVQAGVTYIYKGIVYSALTSSFQFTVGSQKEIFEEDRAKIDLLLRGLIKR